MTQEERRAFANLILLCPNHHQEVDQDNPQAYSPDTLTAWKTVRERGLRNRTLYARRLEQIERELSVAIEPAALPLPIGRTTSYHVFWPRYRRVPFLDLAGHLEQLALWCENPSTISALFVDGDGGVGRTRLAVELCERMSSRGWRAGFVDRETLDKLVILALQDVPKLIVVDYANDDLAAVQAALDRYLRVPGVPSQRTRILLLTRRGRREGPRLYPRQSVATQLLESADHLLLDPDEAFGVEERRVLYRATRQMLGYAPPDSEPNLEVETYSTPLFVTMAAYLSTVEEWPMRSQSRDEILANVLHRESERFWGSAPVAPHLGYQERQQLVSCSTVARVPDRHALATRLQALGYTPTSPESRRVLDWLRDLYPGSGWANGLQPDMLGEYLIARTLQKDLALVVLRHGSAVERSSLLRVLSRVLQTWPEAELDGAIDDLLELLAPLIPGWLHAEALGDTLAADILAATSVFIGALAAPVHLPVFEGAGRLGPNGLAVMLAAIDHWIAQAQSLADEDAAARSRWLLGVLKVQRLGEIGRNEAALDLARTLLDEQFAIAPGTDDELLRATIALLNAQARSASVMKRKNGSSLSRAFRLLGAIEDPARVDVQALEASLRTNRLEGWNRNKANQESWLEESDRIVELRRHVSSSGRVGSAAVLGSALRLRAQLRFKLGADGSIEDLDEAVTLLDPFVPEIGSMYQVDLARCFLMQSSVLDSVDPDRAAISASKAKDLRYRLAASGVVGLQLGFLEGIGRLARTSAVSRDDTQLAIRLALEMARARDLAPHERVRLHRTMMLDLAPIAFKVGGEVDIVREGLALSSGDDVLLDEVPFDVAQDLARLGRTQSTAAIWRLLLQRARSAQDLALPLMRLQGVVRAMASMGETEDAFLVKTVSTLVDIAMHRRESQGPKSVSVGTLAELSVWADGVLPGTRRAAELLSILRAATKSHNASEARRRRQNFARARRAADLLDRTSVAWAATVETIPFDPRPLERHPTLRRWLADHQHELPEERSSSRADDSSRPGS